MTTFLCTGDLHLGAGRDLAPTMEARLAEQRRVWLHLCQTAIDRCVDGVLFAGDAYERRSPSPAEIVAFRDGAQLLYEAGVPLVAITGNHDVSGSEPENAVSASLWPHRQMIVCSQPEVVEVAGVEVACLPWTAAMTRGMRRADVVQALLGDVMALRAQCSTEGQPILLAHWAFAGTYLCNDHSVLDLGEPVLPTREVEGMGWGAIIAGHIHRPQGIGEWGIYVGSPLAVDFGEERSPHGYVLWRDGVIESHDIHPEHPLHTTDLEWSDHLEEELWERWGELPLSRSVVRVRVRDVPQSEQAVAAMIRQAAANTSLYHLHSVQVSYQQRLRARDEVVDETLSPQEALRRYATENHPGREDEIMLAAADYLGQD